MLSSTPSIGHQFKLPLRLLLLAVAALLSVFVIHSATARADSSSTLTVIGTSDVSDSGLIPNVIQPGFEKAFPQFTFKYIGTGTGNAIDQAESGAAGASNLIVHAESLENQFVADGYSYEKYGRALWINDFVLASSQPDPAGVAANAGNNIAQAFADIATAGINGGNTPKATFVSRGGTPGTTVAEHGIWQLVSSFGLSPAGLLLCKVNSTNGGGETPIAAGNGVTASGQDCPGGGALPKGSALPKWYVATGVTQGPNVQAANACNGFPSGPNSCYVFTDGGTYDYLASGTDPAGSVPNLKVVSQDNSASAPGGKYQLINYFHGYIINPNKPNQSVNLPAAKDFLNYITSPSVQEQVAKYLETQGRPAPFTPTASPLLTRSAIPATYRAASGKKLTIKGSLTNAQPGYPVLNNEPVAIDQIVGGVPVEVASGKTNGQGKYSISFVPPATGSYQVTTAQIAKVENPTLNPVFGDLLSPAATSSVKTTVHSAITKVTVRAQGGKALIFGTVSPGKSHTKKATVTMLAKPAGSTKSFKKVATDKLASNDANFAAQASLAPGNWLIQVKYSDAKQVVAAQARVVKVSVKSKPTTSVSFSSVKVKNGKVTVSGKIKPGAPTSGAKVKILAMRTSGGSAQFGNKATVKLKAGKTKFTAHFNLARNVHWVLRIVNEQNGKSTSDTGLKTINVK
jgi:tungstate transport system substrate-binding protein